MNQERAKERPGRPAEGAREQSEFGAPFGDGPSYYQHAERLLQATDPGRSPQDTLPLPDSDTARDPRSPEEPELDELVDALGRSVIDRPPGRGPLLRLDALLRNLRLMHDRTELRARILARDDLPEDRLRALGRWLARTGANVGAVELGLLLLSIAGNDDDRDTILTLSRLDGLCCSAADALAFSQSRPCEALFEMARNHTGWPRIDAVKHLRGATVDRHIQDWLVREACVGDALDNYIADIVAESGDLAGALAAGQADDGLLDGAGWILIAMCDREGPGFLTILDFSAAETVLTAYARHVLAHPPTLRRLSTLMFVHDFLHSGQAERAQWSRGLPAVRALYQDALSSPFARQAIAAALKSGDPEAADRARTLAEHLGVPEPLDP
ncbi:hypothetical protein ACQP1W_43965 [Spirillospora sp. CA-255316]